MVNTIRSRLTYANVMATLAVFVALGGTSYAVATGSIDSRAIKDETIRSRDVRDNSLRARDFDEDDLPTGEEGPQGARGPQGPPGAPGPPGATNLVVRTRDVDLGLAGQANFNVPCLPGERATGGGAQRRDGSTTSADIVRRSAPIVTGTVPTGWGLGASGSGPWLFYAVCVSP